MCNNRRNNGCGCENGISQVLEIARNEACAAAASIEQAEKEVRKTLEAIAEAIAIADEQKNDGDNCCCGCCGCGGNRSNGNGGCISYGEFRNSNWCSCCSC